MNGKLSYRIIDEYIKEEITIEDVKKYTKIENLLQNFDQELFLKLLETYKYCKTETGAWDEDNITQMLIRDIKTSLKSTRNSTLNIFKANGNYETNFGDIALIIRFNYKNGKSFEGFGFIESKRDYRNYNYEYHELKQKQIDRFLQNTNSSFYCFYSHNAFFPLVKTDYLNEHLKSLSLPNINKLDYQLLASTVKPITFQHQLNRFINGYDLDYSGKIKDIAYGFKKEFLPKNIIIINQFENGMEPTPTPTANEKIYETLEKTIAKEKEKKNSNDNDNNNMGFGMGM